MRPTRIKSELIHLPANLIPFPQRCQYRHQISTVYS